MSYPDYEPVNDLYKMLVKADTFKELNDALLYYDELVEEYGRIDGYYGNYKENGEMDCQFGKRVRDKKDEVQEKVGWMQILLDGNEQEKGTIKWSDKDFQKRLYDSDSSSSDEEAGAGASKEGGRRRRRKSKKSKKKKKKKTRKKRKKRKTRKKRKLRKKKRRKTNRK
tara:strand:- start:111 stop:614 length:504 start_codon:yes stop_codon:yes gene_type:complete